MGEKFEDPETTRLADVQRWTDRLSKLTPGTEEYNKVLAQARKACEIDD